MRLEKRKMTMNKFKPKPDDDSDPFDGESSVSLSSMDSEQA